MNTQRKCAHFHGVSRKGKCKGKVKIKWGVSCCDISNLILVVWRWHTSLRQLQQKMETENLDSVCARWCKTFSEKPNVFQTLKPAWNLNWNFTAGECEERKRTEWLMNSSGYQGKGRKYISYINNKALISIVNWRSMTIWTIRFGLVDSFTWYLKITAHLFDFMFPCYHGHLTNSNLIFPVMIFFHNYCGW